MRNEKLCHRASSPFVATSYEDMHIAHEYGHSY